MENNAGAAMPTERAVRSLRLQTAATLLRRAPPHLAALVGERTHEALIALAEGFAVCVQTACYECRLSPGDDRVDLAFCVLPVWESVTDGTLEHLLAAHAHDDRWVRSLSLVQTWRRFDPEITGRIPFVWIAFDLDHGVDALPVPCLGLCVDGGFFTRRLGLAVPGTSAVELTALAQHCHHAVFGRPLHARTRDRIARLVDTRGVPVIARHLSYMASRLPPTFKLDVQLPLLDLAEYLDHISWPGPNEQIAASVRALAPDARTVQLNLVLEPEPRQPLEVELLTDPRDASHGARRTLLAGLVDARLCSEAKAAALETISARPLHSAGPDEDFSVAASWYAKVRYTGAKPVEAKAYVGVMPRWGTRLVDGGRGGPHAGADSTVLDP